MPIAWTCFMKTDVGSALMKRSVELLLDWTYYISIWLLFISIWKALGGNTRDLDPVWEETRQDCNFTRSDFKNVRIVPRDGVRNPRDGVRNPSDAVSAYKRRCQDLNENPIRTLRDYSRPIHEGYRNTTELPDEYNVVPLRSDTILLEMSCLRLFQFSLRDQANNWLEHLPAGSISTWEDLTTRFLAQFFPPGRTSKLRNDSLMFQQHQGESLSEAWTHFKDLL
nr:hypothetical protein [Tanacetum cinerariifolium]